jgi:hypothetical protein
MIDLPVPAIPFWPCALAFWLIDLWTGGEQSVEMKMTLDSNEASFRTLRVSLRAQSTVTTR